jgi:4-carboxymuconolactone decarboxylase
MNNNRLQKGLDALNAIDGEAGQRVLESLKDIAPDFGRFLAECFGDIYSRPGLSVKARETAVIAALAALGHAIPQLRVHIHAGLNVGLTPDEIREIIMMMSMYAGFPAALNAMFAAREVFMERGVG